MQICIYIYIYYIYVYIYGCIYIYIYKPYIYIYNNKMHFLKNQFYFGGLLKKASTDLSA